MLAVQLPAALAAIIVMGVARWPGSHDKTPERWKVYQPLQRVSKVQEGSSLAPYPPLDSQLPNHFGEQNELVSPCTHGFMCISGPVSQDSSVLPPGVTWSTDTNNLVRIDRSEAVKIQQEFFAGNVRSNGLQVISMAPHALEQPPVFEANLAGTTLRSACEANMLQSWHWDRMCMQATGKPLPDLSVRTCVYRFPNAAFAYGTHCGVLFNGTHRAAMEPVQNAQGRVTQKRIRRFQQLASAVSPNCFEAQSHFLYGPFVDIPLLLESLPDTVPILLPLTDRVMEWIDMSTLPRHRILPLEPDVTYVADELFSVMRDDTHGGELWGTFRTGRKYFVPEDSSATETDPIILLNRNDRGSRQLSNHAQLLSALQQAFPEREILDFSGSAHTKVQARDIVRKAAVLVGPHGGGFLNMMFLRPESAVVEIGYTGFGGMHFPGWFAGIAEGLGLHMQIVLADGTYTGPITCNVDVVVQAVREALSARDLAKIDAATERSRLP